MVNEAGVDLDQIGAQGALSSRVLAAGDAAEADDRKRRAEHLTRSFQRVISAVADRSAAEPAALVGVAVTGDGPPIERRVGRDQTVNARLADHFQRRQERAQS